jgi:hypothetical protein
MEKTGRIESHVSEFLFEVVPCQQPAISTEDRGLQDSFGNVFGRKGFMISGPVHVSLSVGPVEGGIELAFSGVEEGADGNGRKAERGSQGVK